MPSSEICSNATRGMVLVLTLALVGAALAVVAPRADAAVPAGWTGPATVQFSANAESVVSATSPTGADAAAWTFSGSTTKTVAAAVRYAGRASWTRIQTTLDARPELTGLGLAAAPSGDFFLTWSEGSPAARTYLMRLPRGTNAWRSPELVFTDANYSYTEPRVTVADTGTVLVSVTAALVSDVSVPPATRIAAATRTASGSWSRSFVTAAGGHAADSRVATTSDGRLAMAFVDGAVASQHTLTVATRGASSAAPWSAPVAVSSVGGVDGFALAAGASGRLALTWTGPAQGTADTATIAWTTVPSAGVASWATRAVATGPDALGTPGVVVGRNGRITAVWNDHAAGVESVVRARAVQAANGVLEPTRQVSASGRYASAPTVSLRPDDAADVIWVDGPTDGGDAGLRIGTVSAVGATNGPLSDTASGAAAPGLGLVTTPDGARHVTWLDASGNGVVRTVRTTLGAPVAVRSLAAPSVVRTASLGGTKRTGNRLTCAAVYWVDATSSSYRWYRDGSLIGGRSSATYTTTGEDYRHRLTCAVTASNQGGGASTRLIKSAASTIAVGVRLHVRKKATITGKRKVGHRLVARHGSWSPGATSYSYRWLRGGKAIAKHATSRGYVLKKKDKRHHISVRVTARKTGYATGTTTTKRTVKIHHR